MGDAVAHVVDVCDYVPIGNVYAKVVTGKLVGRWSLGGNSAERVDTLVEDDCFWVEVGPIAGRGKSNVCVFVNGFVGNCVLDGCGEMFLSCFVELRGLAPVQGHRDALATYFVGFGFVVKWESADELHDV